MIKFFLQSLCNFVPFPKKAFTLQAGFTAVNRAGGSAAFRDTPPFPLQWGFEDRHGQPHSELLVGQFSAVAFPLYPPPSFDLLRTGSIETSPGAQPQATFVVCNPLFNGCPSSQLSFLFFFPVSLQFVTHSTLGFFVASLLFLSLFYCRVFFFLVVRSRLPDLRPCWSVT